MRDLVTTRPFLETHLLCSSGLLGYLEQLPFREPVDATKVESEVYLSFHQSNGVLPDHMIHHKWCDLIRYADEHRLVVGPILAIERLVQEHFCNEKAGSKISLFKFPNWQNLVSRISALPLSAWNSANSGLCHKDSFSWPVYPYHPEVEDYIARERLHESHLHLNGTSSAEDCWLDAMKEPKRACASFDSEFHLRKELRQLCYQVDKSLSPAVLLNRLRLAKNIRQLVCLYALGKSLPEDVMMQHSPVELSRYIDLMEIYPSEKPYSQKFEFVLLSKVFSKLRENDDAHIHRLIWIYFLIQNQYINLLVQRDDFYGFDQFQKYTLTELRHVTELDYLNRFRQIHGPYPWSQIKSLEGRFAPKKTVEKLESLLLNILSGYISYLSSNKCKPSNLTRALEMLDELDLDNNSLQLALVVHFIKSDRIPGEKYPYLKLYSDLENKGSVLLSLINKLPKLKKWVRGVDAAANELHTPPEVFAPLFRIMRENGIPHITYHVGEDFPHLITGIRTIDDALRFLPLRSGDRLGHCTAIGLNPRIWSRDLSTSLLLTQQDRLIDLVFIWRELRHYNETISYSLKAASEAVSLAREIWRTHEELSIETIDAVLSLRELYPIEQLQEPDSFKEMIKVEGFWHSEEKRAMNFINKLSPHIVKLYSEWLINKSIVARRYKTIPVAVDDYSEDTIIKLQQCVMKKLVRMNLAVESLPTSNCRISHYREVTEHHIFRWMGVPGAAIEGDVKMPICLGSDDPGIFSVDLKGEFYHIFVVLCDKFRLSPSEALQKVAEVNERGRVYRFHTPDVNGFSRI